MATHELLEVEALKFRGSSLEKNETSLTSAVFIFYRMSLRFSADKSFLVNNFATYTSSLTLSAL